MGQRVRLGEVLLEWGRIGLVGFGGPPAHIALFRRTFVERKKWLTEEWFEDAIATCNLLPGPASTQLSILCAWKVAGVRGAIVGGLAFISPGLVAVIALAAMFLSDSAPELLLAAGAGASSAVAVVALHSGWTLVPASWARTTSRARWMIYVASGAVAASLAGSWVVVVLLACGAIETSARRWPLRASPMLGPAMLATVAAAHGGWREAFDGSLLWTAAKVGALSYGGGFVIIPMMFTDAVETFAWMSEAQFLDAVVLGQVTPGPVVQTVSVVGFAAAGTVGALTSALVAFAPSFLFVILGARHFESLRGNTSVRAFLDGAGPAAIGAIVGVSVPLAMGLDQGWQFALAAVAAVLMFVVRRGVVFTLLTMACVGMALVAMGSSLPG